MPSVLIADVLRSHRAKREAEDGATARIGLAPDPAAMAFDDGARDRQADAHAVPLGGHERLKKLLGEFRRDARAGVGYADLDHVAGSNREADGQLALVDLLHRLDRIANQI